MDDIAFLKTQAEKAVAACGRAADILYAAETVAMTEIFALIPDVDVALQGCDRALSILARGLHEAVRELEPAPDGGAQIGESDHA